MHASIILDLSKQEVQALMFAEMLKYRPSAGKIFFSILISFK